MSLRLLILLALALPAYAADEKLAGEDDKAVPTAVPTPMGDERGPVQASRTAQAAASFDLPAFVVTGGGERQALARRQDLGLGPLDTSGGLKTSPGEQGAGKDQLDAQAGRESLESLSGSSKPFVAGLRLSGGYQPTFQGSAYAAQELGAWSWSLDGGAGSSEGGPKRGPMRDKALSDQGELNARAGWRGEDGLAINLFGGGAFATRVPQPYLAGQTGALRRNAAAYGLDAETPLLGARLRARGQGGHYKAQLPGAELGEDQGGLDLELSRRFAGRTGSALLELGLGLDASSQSWLGRRRSRSLLHASLLSRFEALPGNRLGLGLALDAVSGDDSLMQLGPRLRLEQRLGAGFSLEAAVDSGLRLSRLKAAQGAGQAWHAPDPSLKPARLVLDAGADLGWSEGPWSLSVGGFAQQGEDWFLPQSSAGSVLAVDGAVRGWRLQGLRAQQAWRQGPWSQRAAFRVQKAELPDLARLPTYTPLWSAELAGAYRLGRLSAELGLDLLGARHAAADGSLPLDPSASLNALCSYDLDDAWTVFAEGRNLAAQAVETAPYYPEAAPYAGLGFELRF